MRMRESETDGNAKPGQLGPVIFLSIKEPATAWLWEQRLVLILRSREVGYGRTRARGRYRASATSNSAVKRRTVHAT